jgi:hypothetical protein
MSLAWEGRDWGGQGLLSVLASDQDCPSKSRWNLNDIWVDDVGGMDGIPVGEALGTGRDGAGEDAGEELPSDEAVVRQVRRHLPQCRTRTRNTHAREPLGAQVRCHLPIRIAH